MDNSLKIKRAEESELELVHRMQILSFKATLEKYQDYDTNPAAETLNRVQDRHRMPNSSYFLIYHAQNPIGAIRIITDEEQTVGRISPMFIVPEKQKAGFGADAVHQAIDLFPNTNRWELDTIEEEEHLCRFYEKLGFRQTGEREKIKEGMHIVNYELSIPC